MKKENYPRLSEDQIKEFQAFVAASGIRPKALYPRIEAAMILGQSPATLDRMRAAGVGPEYKKLRIGKGKNGQVLYPAAALAAFCIDTIKTT